MRIYNSLTRQIENFKPIQEGKVKMYVCGPTVYGPSHLGHASSYIAFDIIRRAFVYLGYDVDYIVNLTDVHDDMIKEANKQGITIFELGDFNIKQYMRDLDSLNILPATHYPRVTENIEGIIEMIKTLVEKGYGYETDDGVYYKVSNFKEYGKLSGIKFEEGKSGERIDTDKYEKDTKVDFALWKKAKEGEPFWESPWGKGRPGWHIECSVMSKKHLGQPFDIHGGGLDLRFPHHENEIAQSEASCDCNFVNYWMHAGLIQVDGRKMSKSLGNFIEIPDLLKQYEPMVVRYWRASVHYRSSVNFQKEAMEAARVALGNLRKNVLKWKEEVGDTVGAIDDEFRSRFVQALENDFSMPEAVGILWSVIKSSDLSDKDKLATILDFDKVLGLGLVEYEEEVVRKDVDEVYILDMIKERDAARSLKDWARADAIRDELDAKGIVLEDGERGTSWSLK